MVIEAAGGLLWRPGDNGIEIAVIHRPKYDDWSLPKGKLEPGEHPLLAALREVEEETGARAVPGRPLGHSRYVHEGRDKRVQWWAMRWVGGEFAPNAEVDEVDWVPVDRAGDKLEPERDRFLVKEFRSDPRPTRACVVVRHARAGSRSQWSGHDDDRPLDRVGRAQAQGVADLLTAYDVGRVASSHVLRCLDTVTPFADRAGIDIEVERLFSEAGFPADPEAAAARAAEIVGDERAVAICTQRGALPDLVVDLCRRLGNRPRGLQPVRKGALVVVHVTADAPASVVAVEQLPATAS